VLASVVFILLGISVAVLSDVSYSVAGVMMGLAASSFAGLRWSLMQLLMKEDPACASDSFVVLYHFSPSAMLSLIPVAIALEGRSFLGSIFAEDAALLAKVIGLVCSAGVVSIALIILEVKLVRTTSSLTLCVLGQVKECVQIAMAMMIFHDRISVRGAIGIAVSLAAAQYYRILKLDTQAQDVEDKDRVDAMEFGAYGQLKDTGNSEDRITRVHGDVPAAQAKDLPVEAQELLSLIPRRSAGELNAFEVASPPKQSEDTQSIHSVHYGLPIQSQAANDVL
jgi:hypothetical protein